MSGTTIIFSLSVPDFEGSRVLELTAETISVSDLEMDMITDYELERGQVIRFHEEIRGSGYGLVHTVVKSNDRYKARIWLK